MSILTGMARARLALQTWLTEAQQAYADLMNEPGTTRPTGASPLLGGVAVNPQKHKL